MRHVPTQRAHLFVTVTLDSEEMVWFVRVCNVQEEQFTLYLFTIQFQLVTNFEKKPFENIVSTGESAGNVFYIPIPQRISVFNLLLFCR